MGMRLTGHLEFIMEFWFNNASFRTDGDLQNINNNYGSTSDVKLKENIVDAKSQWDDIKSLNSQKL